MALKIAKGIQITNLTHPIFGLLEHAHCSSVVELENGEVLVAYFHAVKEAHRAQAIYGIRKNSETGEWSNPYIISKDISCLRMEGNPVLWRAPDTGLLWLFYITSWGGWSTCILRYKTSTDQGHTWSKSTKIYPHMSRVTKNKPILLKNGDYLLPASVEFRECIPIFYRSTDKGKTWVDQGTRVLLPEKYWPLEKAKNSKFPMRMLDQPTIIERTDGSIFCLTRAYRPLGKMYQTISNDGGITWSEPEPGVLPNPDGGFQMIRLLSGNIAIIYNHSSTVRNPLAVAISEDDGHTWAYRRNICEFHKDSPEDEEENFQYPTLTQDKKGLIHATWSNGHMDTSRGISKKVTDIQYTSFTEDWVKEKKYLDNEWEL